MTDDSRSRHPSRRGPRKPVIQPEAEHNLEMLVEQASKPVIRLADLYRKARQQGLIKPHAQYR